MAPRRVALSSGRRLLLALALLATGACATTPSRERVAAPPPEAPRDSLAAVASRTFTVDAFALESGRILPRMTLAFETYGRLARNGRNAILVTHGSVSSHHAAGRYAPTDPGPGWWDGLIGPGKAIDTNRYFVVSSNALGSCYGSTGPTSVNPATGKPYGPDFPAITLVDIVRAQRLLLDSLGVKRLVAVAGPSFGGFQAFQWSVTYPKHMLGVVAVSTAPRAADGEVVVNALVDLFARNRNWNGGWYHDRGGLAPTLATIHADTLRRSGINEILAASVPTAAARDAHIRSRAEAWARQFDPNSMVALARAALRFNVERDLAKIDARVLYVLSRTDRLFRPVIAPDVMDRLLTAGVDVRYFEIDSDFGHLASEADWAKWAPVLKDFLIRLER